MSKYRRIEGEMHQAAGGILEGPMLLSAAPEMEANAQA